MANKQDEFRASALGLHLSKEFELLTLQELRLAQKVLKECLLVNDKKEYMNANVTAFETAVERLEIAEHHLLVLVLIREWYVAQIVSHTVVSPMNLFIIPISSMTMETLGFRLCRIYAACLVWCGYVSEGMHWYYELYWHRRAEIHSDYDFELKRVGKNYGRCIEMMFQHFKQMPRPPLEQGVTLPLNRLDEHADPLFPPGSERDLVVTMTTKKRLDLFTLTMDSLCCVLSDQEWRRIGAWFVVDDGSAEEDLWQMLSMYPFITIITKNGSQISSGHPQSMNLVRSIALDSEKGSDPNWQKSDFFVVRRHSVFQGCNPWHTAKMWKYIFHCEDDHWFVCTNRTRKLNAIHPQFLNSAIRVLESNDAYGQLAFNRNYAEEALDFDFAGGLVVDEQGNVPRHIVHEHYAQESREYLDFCERNKGKPLHAYWPHYTLRPSVMKLSVWKKVGVYDISLPPGPAFEFDYARRFASHNFKTVFFDGMLHLHIGETTRQKKNKSSIDNGKGAKSAYNL